MSKYTQRFLKWKITQDAEIFSLTEQQEMEINQFYQNVEKDEFQDWHRSILVHFVKLDLSNYLKRFRLVRKYNKYSKQWYVFMYDKDGRYRHSSHRKGKLLSPDREDYWISKGFDQITAKNKAQTARKHNSKKGKERIAKLSKSERKKLSVRCKEYWLERGLTENEALRNVSAVQTRDLGFFISKYGEHDGIKKHQKKIRNWSKHGVGHSGKSKISHRWLDSLKVNEREVFFEDLNIKVDGFDNHTNTIYEFYGDYWHGNPDVFPPNGMNKQKKTSFNELYQETLMREEKIKKAGYNLVTMWENDFKKIS